MAIFAELFGGAEEISEHISSWNDLAIGTSNPNPFFESWCLLPALRHLDSEGVQVLVVWEEQTRRTMLGLVPIVVERKYRGLPIKRTGIWRHDYCFLCTPLIAKGRSTDVLQCMLSCINQQKGFSSFVSMYWLTGESEIIPTVAGQSIPSAESIENPRKISRAMVTSVGDYDEVFLPTLNKKKRKELRRNKNRLSELGDLKTLLIDESSSELDTKNAVQEFFDLENRGWKQDKGTAIACDIEHQRYFETCLLKGIANGGAQIVTMTLDAETIASVIVFRSMARAHAYTVKIASNNEYQQYSLGSLLILETTQLAFDNAEILQIDSCAATEHPMINRIWRERKDIVNIDITPNNDYRGTIIKLTDYCIGLSRKLKDKKK